MYVSTVAHTDVHTCICISFSARTLSATTLSQDRILGYISPMWLPDHQASDESRGTDETGHASQVVISLIFYPARLGFKSHRFPS
jgi:hypothetical protein